MTKRVIKRVIVNRAPVVEVDAPKPIPPEPPRPFWSGILTDHNGDFDMGAVLVGVVCTFMCVASGFDVIGHGTKFNAQEFGIGIAAMLGGFAAYKWGDAKRPPSNVTTTSTIVTEGGK